MKYKWLEQLEDWLQTGEQVINIVAPRALIVAVCISLVDLLTSGSLLNFYGFVLAWAVIQAMAVEATLPELWRRAANHLSVRDWLPGLSLALIGILLGVVVFYALLLQFLQQAEHIGLLQAMAWVNVNPATIAFVRAISVVILIPVFAILNRTKSEEKAEELHHLMDSLEKAEEQLSELTELRPNVSPTRELSPELHLVQPNKSEQSEQKAKMREILENNPNIRTGELAALAGVKPPRASEFKKQWLAERQEQAV